MKCKELLSGTGAAVGMLILILDGKTALEGASDGIALCLRSVIPSLFPFILLSIILTNAFTGSHFGILRPIGKLCAIPEEAESILIAGFLGGYPVGAQAVANACRSGQIRKRDAQRMLAFCSNAGPAFLFGICGSLFQRQWMAWALWGIHILSTILVALLIPGNERSPATMPSSMTLSVSEALASAVRVMGSICGWIVLFRIVIAFLSRWVLWLLPVAGQVAVIGALELANGCLSLNAIASEELRFLLCSGMLAFGGCCVAMQTASVISGLSLRYYLLGKVLQTVFSVVLAAGFLSGMAVPFSLLLLFPVFILREMQKKSSNRRKAIV